MLTKRSSLRLISFAAAIIVALGAYGYVSAKRADIYRTQVKAGYMRALGDLSSYMNAISANLEKGSYAGTPAQLSAISSRIWRDSSAAKSSFTSLSMQNSDLDDAYRFLSQAGDYAMSLSRRTANGEELTQEDWDNLLMLRDYAEDLNNRISILQSEVISGERPIENLSEALSPALWPEYGTQLKTAAATGSLDEGTGYLEVEAGDSTYPTLIYDGPFSDHMMERNPRMLKGAKTISREEARKIAARFASVEEDQLSDSADEDSAMLSYVFSTDTMSIGVTQKGGYVTYLLSSRLVGERILSAEEAKAKAEEYLRAMGINSLTATYYETAEGVCTINYAYETQGVTCYTDLIKVGIALDTGEVVFLNTRGYLTNHQEREIPQPAIDEEQARKSVNSRLVIERVNMALVPTPGLNEAVCYEYVCKTDDNRHLLVYVNAETGVEEQILLLIESENGVLTI